MARQSVSAAVRIGVYTHLRWLTSTSSREFPLWKAWLLAGASTVLGVMLSQPIDTVKTTMQSPAWKYSEKGFWNCFLELKDTKGANHLYFSGVFPRLARAVVAAPLTFVFFEWYLN